MFLLTLGVGAQYIIKQKKLNVSQEAFITTELPPDVQVWPLDPLAGSL